MSVTGFEARVQRAVYRHVAETTFTPTVEQTASAMEESVERVREAYRNLHAQRALVLQPDGETIRMILPFSGVPTQHRVRAPGAEGSREYYANCAWDSLGIVAALHGTGEVISRCEQTLEPLHLRVGRDGPEPEPCVVHFAVPAAHWWDDIVYT